MLGNLLNSDTIIRGQVVRIKLRPTSAPSSDPTGWTTRVRFGPDDNTTSYYSTPTATATFDVSNNLIIDMTATQTFQLPNGVRSVRCDGFRTNAGVETPLFSLSIPVANNKAAA